MKTPLLKTLLPLLALLLAPVVTLQADIFEYDAKLQDWRDSHLSRLVNIAKDRPKLSLTVGNDPHGVVVTSSNPDSSPGILTPGTYAGVVWKASHGQQIKRASFVYAAVLRPGLELAVFATRDGVAREIFRVKPETVQDNRAPMHWRKVDLDLGKNLPDQLEFRLWELPAGHPSVSVSQTWYSALTRLRVETEQK